MNKAGAIKVYKNTYKDMISQINHDPRFSYSNKLPGGKFTDVHSAPDCAVATRGTIYIYCSFPTAVFFFTFAILFYRFIYFLASYSSINAICFAAAL